MHDVIKGGGGQQNFNAESPKERRRNWRQRYSSYWPAIFTSILRW